MDRKTVEISVCDVEQYDAGWIPRNLIAAIEWLQGRLASVPEMFRSRVHIYVDSTSYYDSDYATIKISYNQPETNGEAAKRIADSILAAKMTEDMERAQYERLRAKFEGKSQ